MILRKLSPATPGCINDLHSIFEALKEGECALDPLRSLVGSFHPAISQVGGIAGKLALNVANEGILVAKRSIAPPVSFGVKMFPIFGSKLNELILSGKYDLPGGTIEPEVDRTPMTGLFREVLEEGLDLPMLDKEILLGCYAKNTISGIQAVIRMGVAATVEHLPHLNLSCEHTTPEIMTPDHPNFPLQWRELGESAMQLAA